MRRLWAHIILCVTTFILMCVTFTNVFVNAKSNIEYRNGYDLVYSITEKETGRPYDDLTPSQNIAKQMEKRLQMANISQYEVCTEGDYSVRVSFSDAAEASRVQELLAFNGSLVLTSTIDGPVAYASDFLDGDAYIDEINSTYPTVVIPTKVDNPNYTTLIDFIKEQTEGGIAKETGETDDDGNAQTEDHYYVLLWYDFDDDVDSYTKSQETDEEGNPTPAAKKCASKIMMSFDRDELYFPDDEENKLAAVIGITDDNDEATNETIAAAYDRAKFYVNLLNAGTLDYDVKFMYSTEVGSTAAWVEDIINLGDPHATVALSRTLIATLIGAVVVILILAMFYRLGALAASVCTLLTLFSAIGFIVAVGAEFTVAAVVGLLLVALSSLAGVITYLGKFKAECYKGRSIKKANAEAAKKSLLPMVDFAVVTIVVGIFTYAFGGAIMRTFGLVTILGGIIGFLINALGFRGLMWLATNATYCTGKYPLFGVEQNKVPNLVNEEKPTYFGAYADKDFTKKRKPIGIIGGILFVASLVGCITFGALNNGSLYKSGSKVKNSEIVVETTASTSPIDSTLLNSLFGKIYVYEENGKEENAVALSAVVTKITNYTTSAYEKNDGDDYEEVTYYYHVASLNSAITENYNAFYTENQDADPKIKKYEGDINTVLELVFADPTIVGDEKSTALLEPITAVSTEVPSSNMLLVATAVSLGTLMVYFILRYRLSRGVATIVVPTLSTGIVAGFFALTRITTTTYVSMAFPFVAAFTLLLTIMIVTRERELVTEDRTRVFSADERKDLIIKANSVCFSITIVLTILAAYLGIAFFGFGATFTATLFIAITIGTLLAALFVTTLFPSIATFFFKLFMRNKSVSDKPNRRHHRKVKKVVPKSAEPEEAIFIGIND